MIKYFSSIEEVAGEDLDVLREHVLINYEHYDSKDINYLYYSVRETFYKNERVYITIWEDNRIVSVLVFCKAPKQPSTFWMEFISTHKDYRNKGYATKLIGELYKTILNSFSILDKPTLEISEYEQDGIDFLYLTFEFYAQNQTRIKTVQPRMALLCK